jgi:hypothetical protein
MSTTPESTLPPLAILATRVASFAGESSETLHAAVSAGLGGMSFQPGSVYTVGDECAEASPVMAAPMALQGTTRAQCLSELLVKVLAPLMSQTPQEDVPPPHVSLLLPLEAERQPMSGLAQALRQTTAARSALLNEAATLLLGHAQGEADDIEWHQTERQLWPVKLEESQRAMMLGETDAPAPEALARPRLLNLAQATGETGAAALALQLAVACEQFRFEARLAASAIRHRARCWSPRLATTRCAAPSACRHPQGRHEKMPAGQQPHLNRSVIGTQAAVYPVQSVPSPSGRQIGRKPICTPQANRNLR